MLTYSKVWLATTLASDEAAGCRGTQHVGCICSCSMLVSSFLERAPLSAVLFLVSKKKSLSLFNNHQPYVAQTHHDERGAVWDFRALQSQHDIGSKREKENEIKDCLCICQIFKSGFSGCRLQSCSLLPPLVAPAQTYWFFFPWFCVHTPTKTSGDRETGEKTPASACTDAHVRRSAVLVGSLFSLLQPHTTWETFCNTHFMSPSLASVLLSCSVVSGESYGVVSVAASHWSASQTEAQALIG